ncbi:MAG: cytidine deaminase [Candidatus Kerfeldbacteria bacterium]|nr:cytidine deaminase [Candidatus Kerfeldbacteria bacterium]
MTEKRLEALEPEQQELLNAAEKAMERGWNPRSNFVVGAAIRGKSGKIYTGANVTLSTTGMTACAEVAAFLAANMAGEREFTAIATIVRNDGMSVDAPSGPCGRCRQIIFEFSQMASVEPMLTLYSNTDKSRVIVATIEDYLPSPFLSGRLREKR